LKLAFVTLAASLLGAVLVTASSAADRQDSGKIQDRARMSERAEPVRLAEVLPCPSAPASFACVQGRDGSPDERRRPPGAGPGPHRPFPPGPGPLVLASRLGAIETFIGINADQLGAWRDYTDALQAVVRPPLPPEDFKGEPPDALAQSAMLARRAAEQGQQALKLAAAIDELRGKLTPEQLERLKEAGPLLPRPPRPDFGPPPFDPPASFGPEGPGGPGAGHTTPP